MKLIEDSAIVAAGRDLGESDLLVTLLSKGHGKIRAVAKGARRSRKRFLNALEPCTLLHVRVVPPRTSGLCRIDSVEILESFPAIRRSVESYMLASLCCELSDLWLREDDPSPELFSLFTWYLNGISQDDSAALQRTIAFKTRLLSISGYRQRWSSCVRCGRAPKGEKVIFSIDQGGCICDDCEPGRGIRQIIATGTLRSVAYMDSSTLHAIGRLKMAKGAVSEAWGLLSALHRHHLQHSPRSYRVIEPLLGRRLKQHRVGKLQNESARA